MNRKIEEAMPNEKLARVLLTLIANRKRILSKGVDKYATFTLGDNFIQIGLREVIIGDTKYKLPKPKKA